MRFWSVYVFKSGILSFPASTVGVNGARERALSGYVMDSMLPKFLPIVWAEGAAEKPLRAILWRFVGPLTDLPDVASNLVHELHDMRHRYNSPLINAKNLIPAAGLISAVASIGELRMSILLERGVGQPQRLIRLLQ